MTDEDFDIYADIEDFDAKQQVETLKNEVSKLQNLLAEKDHHISSLETDNTKIWKINKSLLYNMSALLKTAKLESARKDKIIADLRKEKDEILFRRERNKTNRKIQDLSTSSEFIKKSSNTSLNRHEETAESLQKPVESKPKNTKRKLSEDDKCAVKRPKSEGVPTEKKKNYNSFSSISLKSSKNTCDLQFPAKPCNKDEVIVEKTNNKSNLLESKNTNTTSDSKLEDLSIENDKGLKKVGSDLKNNEMSKNFESCTISKKNVNSTKEASKIDKIREHNNHSKDVSRSNRPKYQSVDDEKRDSNKSYKDKCDDRHRRASSKDRRHEKKDRYDESRKDKPSNRSRGKEDRHKRESSKCKTTRETHNENKRNTNKNNSKIEESNKDKENKKNQENKMFSDSDNIKVNDLKDLLDQKKALLKELTQAADVIYESDFPIIKQDSKGDNLNKPKVNIHYSIENVILQPSNEIIIGSNVPNNCQNTNVYTAEQVTLTEKINNKISGAFTNKSDHPHKTNNNYFSKIQIDKPEDKHQINVINDDQLNAKQTIKDCSIMLNNEVNTNVELHNMAEFINTNNNEEGHSDIIASNSSTVNEMKLELVKSSESNKTNIETNVVNEIIPNNTQKQIEPASKSTEKVLAQLLGIDSPGKVVPNDSNNSTTANEINFNVNETQGVVKTAQTSGDNQKSYEIVSNTDGQLQNNSNTNFDRSIEKVSVPPIENEQKDTNLNDSGNLYTLSSHATKYECAVDNRNCYKIKLNRVKRKK